MSEPDFDWSPLGAEWWAEAASTCGATVLQKRFACCRHRGMTASGSAAAAGYAGDDDSIRQAGSRAAKSTAVMQMLAMAKAETGGGEDGVVGGAEAKRILSRLARGSDPNVRIKALESLNKLEQSEREERESRREMTATDALREMLTVKHGVGIAGLMYLGALEQYGCRVDLRDGIPLFPEMAPLLSREYPEIWARIRDHLDPQCRAEADAMAAVVPVSMDRLVANPAQQTEATDAGN